jgi:hypothetical protein
LTGLIAGVSIDTPTPSRIPIGVLAFGVSVAIAVLSWRFRAADYPLGEKAVG